MNDKKGFTLIELVAVIVIIGILAFLIIPSVASYIVNTKESTYKSHEKAMNEAAESYTIDCISSNGVDCDIPLPNEERNVYLSELIDKEFISKLGDPAKKNSFCNPNISYVKEQNTGDNDFEYLACLYCSIYATENPNCVTYTGDSDKPVCKIIETHSEWTNGSRQVKVGCEDATSGCLRNEFKKTFSTTTDKGIITITDKSGNSTDCEVEVKVDKNLPTCKIVTTDTPINGWYPFGSKFTITDMQDGESGLLTYGMGTSVEADFNKKREYVPVQGITRVFGYVKDNAGNIGKCSINAKVKTKFTVHYDKNNGTGSMPNKICMVDDDCYLDTNTFTRVGYTFDGWNTRADGTGISYADRANVKNIVFSGNVTLYAKWKPHTLTINFHGPKTASKDLKTNINYAAWEKLSGSPYIFKYDSPVEQVNKIKLNVNGLPNYLGSSSTWNLSSTGYTMDTNWIIGSNTSTNTISANKYFNNAQTLATDLGLSIDNEDQIINLYARATNHTYKIVFKGNGSTSGNMSDQLLTYDDVAQTLNENKYKKEYIITYDPNGGTISTPTEIVAYDFAGWTYNGNTYEDKATIRNLTSENNGELEFVANWSLENFALQIPERIGYTFKGWFEGNNQIDAVGFKPVRNMTLRAEWYPKAVITCNNTIYDGTPKTIATCSGGNVNNAVQTDVGEYEISCNGDDTHSDAESTYCGITSNNSTCKAKTFRFYSSKTTFTKSGSLTSATTPICEFKSGNSATGSVNCSYNSSNNTMSFNITNAKLIAANSNDTCKIYTKKILGKGTSDVFYHNSHCYYFSAYGFASSSFACGSHSNPLSNSGYRTGVGPQNHCPGLDSLDSGYRRFCRANSNKCYSAGKSSPYSDGRYSCKCYIRTDDRKYADVTIEVKYDCNAEITCTNKTYNGSQQTIATCSGGTIGNAIQKNAGDYMITCTGDENHINAENKVCSINPQTCPAGYQNTSEGGCTPIIYSIDYNLDGGSVSGNPTTYTIESNNITLNNPTKAHYVFAGWTGTGLTRASSSVTIPKGSKGDRTYTATWNVASKASITCDNKTYTGSVQTIATCSGGTIANASQSKVGSYTITCTGDSNHSNAESKVCSISPQTCPAGYQNTSEGGCTPIIYSIGYNLDGGSVSGNPTTYTIESNNITLNNPTKSGFNFAGWTGTGLSSATTSVTIPKGSTGNRSYTATWRAAVITVVADGFCSRSGACNCDSQATGTCMYTNHNMEDINGQGAYNCPRTHVNPSTGASENLIGVSACGQASAFAEARIDQTGCYKIEMNGKNLRGDAIIVGIHFLKGREHFRTDTETFTKTKIVFYAKISEAASYTFGIRSFPNSGCWMGALGETFNNVVITRVGDLSHSKCANDNVCYYDNNTCTR